MKKESFIQTPVRGDIIRVYLDDDKSASGIAVKTKYVKKTRRIRRARKKSIKKEILRQVVVVEKTYDRDITEYNYFLPIEKVEFI